MILEIRIYPPESGMIFAHDAFHKKPFSDPILVNVRGERIQGKILNIVVDPSGKSANVVIEVPKGSLPNI